MLTFGKNEWIFVDKCVNSQYHSDVDTVVLVIGIRIAGVGTSEMVKPDKRYAINKENPLR